ncbi:hypothetical protein C0416_01415 [bacterium]|nr:hypothetical protein [bacterium]
MQNIRLKTNHGFLLVETIISITILVMIAATSISLLIMGHRAINMNKNSLEASWIAQESAESLRGLRDTNWIRYGFDKENCWNIAGETCDPPLTVITFTGAIGTPGTYFLETSLDGAPKLIEGKYPLDLKKGPDNEENAKYLLYYQDIDPANDYDDDGTTNNDKQYIGPKGAGYTVVEPSKYYRAIETMLVADGEIEATAIVGWYEGSTPHQINLPVTLTNYQLEE